jgi:hypothetical protein
MKISEEAYRKVVVPFEEEGTIVIRQPRPSDTIYHVGVSYRQELQVFLTGKALPDNLENPEEYYPYALQAYEELDSHIPECFTYKGKTIPEFGYGFVDNYGNETTELTISDDSMSIGVAIALIQNLFDERGQDIYIYDDDCIRGIG